MLLNRDAEGQPVIRKASGHGLGHLMDPYKDPAEVTAKWVEEVGAPRWQADLWREIIRATYAGTPDIVPLDHLPGFDQVARSQYAATTPALLSWFDAYNEGKSYAEQVKPFNFLLSLQLRSEIDLAADDFETPSNAAGDSRRVRQRHSRVIPQERLRKRSTVERARRFQNANSSL